MQELDTSGISVISTGSVARGVRGNQYSVSLTSSCTEFENEGIKNIPYKANLVLTVCGLHVLI